MLGVDSLSVNTVLEGASTGYIKVWTRVVITYAGGGDGARYPRLTFWWEDPLAV